MTDTLTGVANEAVVETTQVDDATTDYLEALVGEGKKYKDPKDLAKAYINADLHIRELQSRLDDNEGSSTLLNEVLSELRKTPAQEPAARSTTEPVVSSNSDDIAKTVDELLRKKEQERLYKENTQTTFKKLEEFYGNRTDALKAVKKLTTEKPSLVNVLNELGNTDPDAAVAFITSGVKKPTSSSNTPGINDTNAANGINLDGPLTWEKAKKIRKENPAAYNSRGFRAQLEQEVARAAAQGKDFFA